MCVCVAYRLVPLKWSLHKCCFALACACWFSRLTVTCVTWKAERHVNKPLFSSHCLLWHEGRWQDCSSEPERSQTILLMRSRPVWPPPQLLIQLRGPLLSSPLRLAPAPLFSPAQCTSPQRSFRSQTPAYFPLIRCRKWIFNVCTQTHLDSNYVHNACTDSSTSRGHGHSKLPTRAQTR